jgi:hypothetical protein
MITVGIGRGLRRNGSLRRPWSRARLSEVARQSFLDRVKRPNTRASLLGAPGDIAGAGSRFLDSVSDGCVDDLRIN